MFLRPFAFAVLLGATAWAQFGYSQAGVTPRAGSQLSEGNSGLRKNSFAANKPVAMPNKIIKPIPLSIEAQRNALMSIDRSIIDQVDELNKKLKAILPDELAILAKTAGWKSEDQQKLVIALRAGDPTAVYEAWTRGNPQDTAGAEIAGRQTDVKKVLARLTQNAEKSKTSVKQDVSDLDMALSKIASSTEAVAELSNHIKSLKTWVEARTLIESAESQKGLQGKLPAGDVTLVFDPTLAVGTAIVLSNDAMLIGYEGIGPLNITQGNAAKALHLPIVTGSPLPVIQGEEIREGIVIANPKTTRTTINYNINGNHYVMEPGMVQKLAPTQKWIIEFDRGGDFGDATYTLSEGTYHFTPTDKGWQIYKHRFDVVLDNSMSDQEFNLLFRGENLSVPAGGTRKLSSTYPIVVGFDRANGTDFVTKTLPPNGNVQIGVNSSDNQWDLFPTSDNRREVSNLKPFNPDGAAKP